MLFDAGQVTIVGDVVLPEDEDVPEPEGGCCVVVLVVDPGDGCML